MAKKTKQPSASVAVDLGCGGGIYTEALADIGFTSVVGIDFSTVMLEEAKKRCQDIEQISFQLGTTEQTGLPDQFAHFLMMRAVTHHLQQLQPTLQETRRVLQNDGLLLIQDRTLEDCFHPGSVTHLRGFFYEVHPFLAQIEEQRRHSHAQVITALKTAGFHTLHSHTLWEPRKSNANLRAVQNEILERRGRSLLHHLDDEQLVQLWQRIEQPLVEIEWPLVEIEPWTVWCATK